ncbi:Smr/MutS family protein [Stakelama sp. CBK3Z-3]|uniref:Smr/MutS family protein n=1 Tax=Stakelama flava TaxID=2860338 RepID=A0ABS6XPY6_9SPHN|nr:Smr/MutS family protein [Stakelama flava]MBW4332279.1 Smr/MutS family protein [Stakelama flava]
MARRNLSPEEAAMWARVMATVRPLKRDAPSAVPGKPESRTRPAPAPLPPVRKSIGRVPPVKRSAESQLAGKAASDTLDGGWDRRIGRGRLVPDSTIDLHGHTLASAHAALERGLARGIAEGERVLLLVTGKPPRPGVERPYARGAIRASVNDWLALSPNRGAVAAVRAAHPRHGGQGALYIILRRTRLND